MINRQCIIQKILKQGRQMSKYTCFSACKCLETCPTHNQYALGKKHLLVYKIISTYHLQRLKNRYLIGILAYQILANIFSYTYLQVQPPMQESQTKGKKQTRRPITSHTLRLQNFRLGVKYLIFDQIATGEYSDIYHGVEENSKQQRVFKFYNLKEIEETKGFKQKQLCKRLSNYEHQISKSCKSINILKCLDIYEDRNHKILVYEFCQKSLQEEINRREDKRVSEIRAILILKQILSGLRSLHLNAKLLHTNLQAGKIFMRNGVYKLIDFGLPSFSRQAQNVDAENFLVPEIMRKQAFDQKAQVWSIGVLFHHILYGQLPIRLGKGIKDLLMQPSNQSIFLAPNDRLTSKKVIDFLKRCLYVNPQSRMGLSELESHEMFQILQQGIESNVQERKKQFSSIIIGEKNTGNLSVLLPISQERQLTQQIQRQQLNQFYKQKFHMDQLRSRIEKTLQKQYQRLGQSFQIQQLQKASVKFLRSQVNRKEVQTYNQMKKFYLQCLKVQFIFHEILKPLLTSKSSKKQRYEVQLFYLILSTSFTTLSRLKLIQKKQKQIFSQYHNLLANCVQKATAILYKNVEEQERTYSNLLTKIENGFRSIFSDKVSKFLNKEQMQRKDLFLGGVQSIDFDQKKKIDFTQAFFRLNRDNMITSRQKQKEYGQSVKTAFAYLQIYAQIWDITNENEIQQKYPSLKCFIDKKVMPNAHRKPSRVRTQAKEL